MHDQVPPEVSTVITNCRLSQGNFDRHHQGVLLSDTFAGGVA